MKEKKSVVPSRTVPHVFIQLPTPSSVALFRIAFGIVWLVDAALKFLWLQPSDMIALVQKVSQGQPAWLHSWYNFWTASLTSTPTAFLHGIGLIELALGLALVIGFLRKTVYFGGILLSLMIWSIVEGFGGPYGPGSTDVGAAIMYAFIFVAIIIVERSSNYNKYSLDALIERKLNGWKHLAELYKDKHISPNEFQTASETILPKVDSLLVENVILSQQQQLPVTVEVFSDGSRKREDVEEEMPAEESVSVIAASSNENWSIWYDIDFFDVIYPISITEKRRPTKFLKDHRLKGHSQRKDVMIPSISRHFVEAMPKF
jgi:thiosulfate dehydrogenase [quinone] large subunit